MKTCRRCEEMREAGIKATWCVDCKESLGIKEVDDTPVNESESDDAVYRWLTNLEARIVELENELALLNEQRETVRAPECQEDPEWF